jgi:hypothetical protein
MEIQIGNHVIGENHPVYFIADVGAKPEAFAEIVGGVIPDWMGGTAAKNLATGEVRQQYEQAQENWVTANLRAESGAVIGEDEMRKEIKKWFPQIGDSEAEIKQKEKARSVVENAMRLRAGRAVQAPQTQNVVVDY